jgi:hypothetical protein
MSFALGLIIGGMIGATLGFLVAGLMSIAK